MKIVQLGKKKTKLVFLHQFDLHNNFTPSCGFGLLTLSLLFILFIDSNLVNIKSCRPGKLVLNFNKLYQTSLTLWLHSN